MSSACSKKTERSVPICVDLDGTLLHTDMLLESLLVLLKRNILFLFMLPLWLLRGRSYFKHEVAIRSDIDVRQLPYNNELIDYLLSQQKEGRAIVLVTASDKKFADQIAGHLGFFDQVLASDTEVNLSGDNKLKVLVSAFGEKGFDYAGNAEVDLKIWPHSREPIIVSPEPGVLGKLQKTFVNPRIFNRKINRSHAYLKALRLHQWVKNVLIFIPLLMAHKLFEPALIGDAFLAFVSFGLCASAGYIINDMLDVESDRKHKTKCNRPLASGALGIKPAALMIILLAASSFAIASWLPSGFALIVFSYFVITCTYSLWMKNSAFIDVLILAGLYSLRLIAGATAVSVDLSLWLLSFSMFLFFSLALVKRFSELMTHKLARRRNVSCRGYRAQDTFMLAQIGVASGLLAVLVLALYIDSEAVKILYSYPELIWLICPLLLYWVCRVWLIANRGGMNDDPVLFAIKDVHSIAIALVMMAIIWMAA